MNQPDTPAGTSAGARELDAFRDVGVSESDAADRNRANGMETTGDRQDTPVGVPATDGSGFGIAQLRTMIWRQRWIVIAAVALALLAGLIFTLMQTPMYKTAAAVKIDNESLQIIEGQDVNPGVAAYETGRYFSTQREIVQSRSMAGAVADALGLARDNSFIERMTGATPEAIDGSPEQVASARRSATISLLQGNVEMVAPQDSRIAQIGFTSRDQVLAAEMANAYAENYVSGNVKASFDANSYARTILTEQVQEAGAKLRETEIAIVEYIRANRLVGTQAFAPRQSGGDGESKSSGGGGGGGSIAIASLDKVNNSYLDARSRRIEAEQRWRTAQSADALSLPEARNNGALQNLISQRAILTGELAELERRYLSGTPQVEQAQARLSTLNNQIGAMAGTIRNSIRNEYRTAQQQEAQLERDRNRLSDETLSEQNGTVQLNLLQRDADLQRDRVDELQKRLNEVESASDITANNISILDRALVPNQPFEPNLMRNLLMALLAGLGIGGGIAFLREAIDDRLRSPEEAEAKLGVPLLGSTPAIDEDAMQSVDDPKNVLNEAYFSIRTALEYANRAAQPILQVTSSQAAEGKTTTAIALARDYAANGSRVLLIDGDLRKPSLHKRLGLDNERGLIDVLQGRAEVLDVASLLESDRLTVLTLGKRPPNPVQFLSGKGLDRVIDRERANFDVIIIDSAPVMGLADAPLIAARATGTILVVEAGRSHSGQVRTAIRRLRESGGNVLGLVMTKFDFRQAGYTYDYHYSYYSYGDDGHTDDRAA